VTESVERSDERWDLDRERGLLIGWDVAIPMDDGLVLRADVFQSVRGGQHPVILGYGPYGKGLAFQEGYPDQWRIIEERYPEALEGSSNVYQNWEVVDPEQWVPEGYVCVRVDSRGAGRSPGFLDPWSPRETRDLYECIEWAAAQPWSSGRIGLSGISYLAMNQWTVASLQPPHLAAICAWEGAADFYRDTTYHGGIRCVNWDNWYEMQVMSVQHGVGDRGPRNPLTGETACGPETLTDEELAANRVDFAADIRTHPLDDDYHRGRSPIWDRVTVPLLSAANWGGQALHARGNFEGFARAASTDKWLEVHGGEHWTAFYAPYGVELQKRFFGHFLKDEDTGWHHQPRLLLQLQRIDGTFQERGESEWPLAQTRWTRLYLDASERSLQEQPGQRPESTSYDPLTGNAEFLSAPFERETELTGPSAATLFVSSATTDADLFLILRLLDPDGEEVVFQGSNDPRTALGKGWLRASHRWLDPDLTLDYRPYHTHDRVEPLQPGAVYELAIEIWPLSVIAPAGYRLGLVVQGRDYERDEAAQLANFRVPLRGSGPYLHTDPDDRPVDPFAGRVTVHTGTTTPSSLLLPVIPES
jgi:hypothetical protein